MNKRQLKKFRKKECCKTFLNAKIQKVIKEFLSCNTMFDGDILYNTKVLYNRKEKPYECIIWRLPIINYNDMQIHQLKKI